MSDTLLFKPREIIAYYRGQGETREDPVVQEIPLTLFLNGTELATMVCSPGGYKELGVGFLLTEGLISQPADIIEMNLREEEGLLWITTSNPIPQTGTFLRRHIASCCGKSRVGLYFINDARQLKPIESDVKYNAEHLLQIINGLEDRSATFRKTGGVHSSALADQSGILCMYEDIGRHNAVDKVLGYAFLHEINTADKCLLLSGRVASEILIKAARAKIPVILSRSAPTGLTLDLAEELNITVVGFARGERLNIYSHPERIVY